MHDFNCKNPEEMYSEVLSNRVHELKTIQEGVNDMCQEMEQLFREGVAEGKTEGMVLKSKEIALTMNESGFSVDMIAQMLKVSVSEVQNWISENLNLPRLTKPNLNDMEPEMKQLYNDGKSEGIATGELNKSKEIARSMNQSGFSIHMISQILKVSISEVQDWISENRTPGK